MWYPPCVKWQRGDRKVFFALLLLPFGGTGLRNLLFLSVGIVVAVRGIVVRCFSDFRVIPLPQEVQVARLVLSMHPDPASALLLLRSCLAAVYCALNERRPRPRTLGRSSSKDQHFHLEARSEQRAPAADTKTDMTLSKIQPQKEPRRGNLQARA